MDDWLIKMKMDDILKFLDWIIKFYFILFVKNVVYNQKTPKTVTKMFNYCLIEPNKNFKNMQTPLTH